MITYRPACLYEKFCSLLILYEPAMSFVIVVSSTKIKYLFELTLKLLLISMVCRGFVSNLQIQQDKELPEHLLVVVGRIKNYDDMMWSLGYTRNSI